MDNSSTDPVLRHLAQEIIREGVVIFFPRSSSQEGVSAGDGDGCAGGQAASFMVAQV